MAITVNGRADMSDLGPITKAADGAQVYLRKDAALAFMAMNEESQDRFGVTLRALGSMSAYRSRPQQDYLWNNVPHARDPNWVARPGTSNHGWGLAIDLADRRMRWVIDQIGAKYGFAKRWSDAPLEWWHIKWRPGTYQAVKNYNPQKVIRKGSKGREVQRMQVLLRRAGYLPKKWHVHTKYTLYVRRALRKFQRDHNLPVDGVVGPKTWAMLRKARPR
jgi:hypothetical protein